MDHPQKVGRYELIRELDVGGMAIVYLARDPRTKREVAIKVLMPTLARDPEFRQRFVREAETIARLEHPAIVPLYDVGDENELYLVMRYMTGGSLRRRLDTRPYTIPEIAVFMQRIGPPLSLAHSRDIVHRDIKPGNVLFDDLDQAYLSDFGIAKVLNSAATITTQQMGSPVYMSPEQINSPKEIDHRSDIYALGVMLFELLSGQRPYTGDTPLQLLAARLMQPIPPIHTLKPDLPPDWDIVVRRAMAENRDERYQTVADFVADVTAVADGRTPAAAPLPVPELVVSAHIPSQSFPASIKSDYTHTPTPIKLGAGGPVKEPTRRWDHRYTAVILLLLALIPLGVWWRNGRSPDQAEPTPTAVPVVVVVADTATATPSSTLTRTPTASATATATPTRTPTPTWTPSPTQTATAVPELLQGTVRSPANVRSGPGANFVLVTAVNAGDTVIVLAQNETGDWYYVELADGRTGWIAAQFVEIPPPTTPIPIVTISAATVPATITATRPATAVATAPPPPTNTPAAPPPPPPTDTPIPPSPPTNTPTAPPPPPTDTPTPPPPPPTDTPTPPPPPPTDTPTP